MSRNKYTKELLSEVAAKSVSIQEVMKCLGLKLAGGTHQYIKNRLKFFEIDISHFLGSATNSGKRHKGGSKKKSWNEVLVFRNSGNRQAAFKLRRALIESGREYACEECGQLNVWNNKPLRLEVDHKNNNWLDDRPENLQFICPCCHSQRFHSMNQGLTDETDTSRYFRQRRKNK